MKRLALIIFGMVIIVGAVGVYRLYRDSSATPFEALNDYVIRITDNSPQKIESVHVVSSKPSSRQENEQILLFQASDPGLQTHVTGYATVKKSPFGWFVDKFQMVGRSPSPTDVMAGLDRSDGIPVVYGQVFLAEAASVEALFSDPNQGDVSISADIPEGNFAIFGMRHSEWIMLEILDDKGNVLRQLTRDELQDG